MLKAKSQLPLLAGNVTRVADSNDGVHGFMVRRILATNFDYVKSMTAGPEASAQPAFASESHGTEGSRVQRVVSHRQALLYPRRLRYISWKNLYRQRYLTQELREECLPMPQI